MPEPKGLVYHFWYLVGGLAVIAIPLVWGVYLFQWGYELNEARSTPLFYIGGGLCLCVAAWMAKNFLEYDHE